MDLIEFISNNLPEGYSFNLKKELSYNFDGDLDNVILKVQEGNHYQNGIIYPITLIIVSKNVNNSLQIWNEFVASVSDQNFPEGTSNYYMIFQTPSVSQVFDENKNNYYSTITVFGTVVFTTGILDIKKVEIDGVEISINSFTYQLENIVDSEQRLNLESSEDFLNKTEIKASVLSLNIITFLKDYQNFSLKLMNMRKNQLSPNEFFTIKITYIDDSVEENEMKLIHQAIQKNRGAIPTFNLYFSK